MSCRYPDYCTHSIAYIKNSAQAPAPEDYLRLENAESYNYNSVQVAIVVVAVVK